MRGDNPRRWTWEEDCALGVLVRGPKWHPLPAEELREFAAQWGRKETAVTRRASFVRNWMRHGVLFAQQGACAPADGED